MCLCVTSVCARRECVYALVRVFKIEERTKEMNTPSEQRPL